jgi:hypothetical protein
MRTTIDITASGRTAGMSPLLAFRHGLSSGVGTAAPALSNADAGEVGAVGAMTSA